MNTKRIREKQTTLFGKLLSPFKKVSCFVFPYPQTKNQAWNNDFCRCHKCKTVNSKYADKCRDCGELL